MLQSVVRAPEFLLCAGRCTGDVVKALSDRAWSLFSECLGDCGMHLLYDMVGFYPVQNGFIG